METRTQTDTFFVFWFVCHIIICDVHLCSVGIFALDVFCFFLFFIRSLLNFAFPRW